MVSLSQEANELRKLGKYEEALKIYNSIDKKDNYIVSGMSYCYRKLENGQQAVALLNNYLRENNINLKNEGWLKTEVVWAYVQYYLNEKYLNKEIAIKAANIVVDLENSNEIIIKKIKKVLCTDDVIKKYPKELKELIGKIDGSKLFYLEAKKNIKDHLQKENNINTCINYTLILSKIKVLLELKEYNEIINIHSKLCDVVDDRHLERGKAKALQGLGRDKEAIDILEKTNIKYGKQYYVYADIGDIYNSMNNIDKALEFYYTALDLCHEDKFMLTILYKVSRLLLDVDNELSRKHIDLDVLIKNNEGWKIKSNESDLLKQLNSYEENSDYKSLKKELKLLWKTKVNEGRDVYEGIIDKVLDNGNGFIKYEEDKMIFFKKDKKNQFSVEDKVIFYIEKSYDRKKERYSKVATQLRYKK